MNDHQPVPFTLRHTELEKLRRNGRPNDGLHQIDRFGHHPGYRGFARDSDGTGLALLNPNEDQMAALFCQMLAEGADGHGWGV